MFWIRLPADNLIGNGPTKATATIHIHLKHQEDFSETKDIVSNIQKMVHMLNTICYVLESKKIYIENESNNPLRKKKKALCFKRDISA